KYLIEEKNYLDAIIGLPANIFFGTSIPTTVLVFKKSRAADDVLFIDASQSFEKGKNQNRSEEHTSELQLRFDIVCRLLLDNPNLPRGSPTQLYRLPFPTRRSSDLKYLIEEKNYLDAIIGLPANIFFGTSIPTTVLVFKKSRAADDVLFIDASQSFEKGKNQN